MAANTPDDPEERQSEARHPATQREAPSPQDLVVVDPSTGHQLGPVTQFEYWRSGPLPTGRELAEYDTVIPGLAERIVQRLGDRD